MFRVNQPQQIQITIAQAAERGYTDLVRDNVMKVDPTIENNRAIRDASFNGHTEIVKYLLSNPLVDPNAENSDALLSAIANGHTDIVQLLIADKRTKIPSNVLDVALENEREDILEILRNRISS
jgi:ankyrin repeat protein